MSDLLDRLAAPASAPGGALPDWVASVREQGRERFGRHGLPHRRLEAWKYTPLDRLVGSLEAPQASRATAMPGEALALETDQVLELQDGLLTGERPAPPDGVEVLSMAQALADGDEVLCEQIQALDSESAEHAMVAMNNAALGRGLVVRVARDVDAGALAVRLRSTESGQPSLANIRVLLLLEDGAVLDWIEDAQLTGSTNIVTQAVLGAGSRLRHARLQDNGDATWYISRTDVSQAEDSRFEQSSLDLGAGLARHDLRIALAGTGAACKLLGAYLTDGNAHVDHHLDVRHEAPGCHSEQTFHGVLHGQSRGVFNGRVHVLPGADESEAHQSNANLLLSREAEVDTKPELIIEADEVVASHGATVGQLDEAAIFYLRSRGIDGATARQLLTGAFCRSVVDAIGIEAARDAFSARLEQHLEKRS